MSPPATVEFTWHQQADKSSLVGHAKDIFVRTELEITHHRIARMDHVWSCGFPDMSIVEDLKRGCEVMQDA